MLPKGLRRALVRATGAPSNDRATTRAPISVSRLALFGGVLIWVTLMLLLGFSAEATAALLSSTTLAVNQLSGLPLHRPTSNTALHPQSDRPSA